MIHSLPYDIQWYIAHYIEDIDTRRHFNIYKKINIQPFIFLNSTIENLYQNKYYIHFKHSRFSFVSNFI